MSDKRRRAKRDESTELQSIRDLLIILLLKMGATSEEINIATGMGAGNIRAKFSRVKKGKGRELE